MYLLQSLRALPGIVVVVDSATFHHCGAMIKEQTEWLLGDVTLPRSLIFSFARVATSEAADSIFLPSCYFCLWLEALQSSYCITGMAVLPLTAEGRYLRSSLIVRSTSTLSFSLV